MHTRSRPGVLYFLDLVLDLDLDLDLVRALDLDLVCALDLDLVGALAHALVRALHLDLVRALDLDLVRALALALVRALDLDLVRALALCSSLDQLTLLEHGLEDPVDLLLQAFQLGLLRLLAWLAWLMRPLLLLPATLTIAVLGLRSALALLGSLCRPSLYHSRPGLSDSGLPFLSGSVSRLSLTSTALTLTLMSSSLTLTLTLSLPLTLSLMSARALLLFSLFGLNTGPDLKVVTKFSMFAVGFPHGEAVLVGTDHGVAEGALERVVAEEAAEGPLADGQGLGGPETLLFLLELGYHLYHVLPLQGLGHVVPLELVV